MTCEDLLNELDSAGIPLFEVTSSQLRFADSFFKEEATQKLPCRRQHLSDEFQSNYF
jgi:hypothetical protein